MSNTCIFLSCTNFSCFEHLYGQKIAGLLDKITFQLTDNSFRAHNRNSFLNMQYFSLLLLSTTLVLANERLGGQLSGELFTIQRTLY